MLEHHITEVDVATIERNAKGSVVGLVRYPRASSGCIVSPGRGFGADRPTRRWCGNSSGARRYRSTCRRPSIWERPP